MLAAAAAVEGLDCFFILVAQGAALVHAVVVARIICEQFGSAGVSAVSFDVEDYFHVSNFESFVSFEDWGKYESRVERNTRKILEILTENGVTATFFVLGWVAERFPKLVGEIADAHHELGTHSYRHRLI